MVFQDILNWFSEENITHLIETFRSFGIFIAFLLPFIEAFIPFLPIILFVIVNVNAYGLLLGFIITWAGTVTGSYLVFLIFRLISKKPFMVKVVEQPKVVRFIHWIDSHGFGPLFILLCFPFTPGALVNMVSAFSHISKQVYLIALILSKAIMIFTLSYIGSDINSFFASPKKSIIVLVIIFILWLVGKGLEKYFDNRLKNRSS
ncbi:TVP38/TMEM64 family protein [Mammaliicoccus sp. Dog046]|uniref:TVP38/TMEM64 family protein n=1 Tax=Mammaliicoccus sp. Dog046 TaxID=3034233 RepID=UPI002B259DC7|nr:TVP38/TMEM64 family protein [Mammaliicoccus sp. Dog046]WQK84862.1 TVP38/TMEM64 family protein [Mammaliicoccus sp. Dog046]